jgi:hypothetical protein
MSDPHVPAAPRYTPGHLAALRRFAVGITVITLLGHAVFGFEQSYAQPLVALATAYGVQLLLEVVDARATGRRPRFLGGPVRLIDFLLSAHISALAVTMLLYYNDRLWVVAFAAAVAIGSKSVFRVPYGAGTRHVFNPSNFAISVTLLAFPWVGLAMPWQFTAELGPVGDWLLPAAIFGIGLFVNGRFTKRLPVIFAFLGGFALQAVVRTLLFDASLLSTLAPATGVAAVIYTFFMLSDPATTPDRPGAQVAFGLAVAGAYLVFVALHIVFGLFFGLTVVCGLRGLVLYATWLARRPAPGTPAAVSAAA